MCEVLTRISCRLGQVLGFSGGLWTSGYTFTAGLEQPFQKKPTTANPTGSDFCLFDFIVKGRTHVPLLASSLNVCQVAKKTSCGLCIRDQGSK